MNTKKVSIYMRNILYILFLGLILQSCYTKYSICLSSVESPDNTKERFGKTKITSIKDVNLSKYRYEDTYIDIVWYVSSTKFNFELKNKSEHTIKINWDDVSYVDIKGKTKRVMHAGVNYTDRNNSQPPTSIPKNAIISDVLLPTDNVSPITDGETIVMFERDLIRSSYNSMQEYNIEMKNLKGKKMMILMPIVIENIQNDYIFEFTLEELINNKPQ